MERVTKAEVRETFTRFVKVMGLPTEQGEGNEFAALDHYSPGGNPHTWRVVIINKEHGGHQNLGPSWGGRMTAREIVKAMRFAMYVKEYQDKGK